jgi:hypothetical protein
MVATPPRNDRSRKEDSKDKDAPVVEGTTRAAVSEHRD